MVSVASEDTGMTVQELAEALEQVDGQLPVVMPPQPNEPDGNMGFRVTGYSVGADHVTLHVQGVRRG